MATTYRLHLDHRDGSHPTELTVTERERALDGFSTLADSVPAPFELVLYAHERDTTTVLRRLTVYA